MKNKYQKNKNKVKTNHGLADCALTDHQRLIQTEDLEWILMVNKKRKNIQRSYMEDLYIGNLTNDTTEE